VKDVVLAVRSDVEMAEGPSQISRTDSIPKGIPRDHVGSVKMSIRLGILECGDQCRREAKILWAW
jgi:hypothetical protein